MSVQPDAGTNASIPELFTQLSAQTTRLVRDEMRLAQKELQESVRHAGIGAGLISVAGLLAVLGSATVVAALVAGAGIAALVSKKQAEQVPPPAEESIVSVKRDIAQIKEAANDRS